jgi:hypothetical protein
MSTAGRDQSSAPAASDVAAALREAGFVRLVARADGDALAAAGVLARALDARGTPFQATVVRPFSDATRATDADLTVAVGHTDATADVSIAGPEPSSAIAFEAVREFGESPDVTLALAGALSAGETGGTVVEAAERAGIERRFGVAVPVADLADGLAHATLVHAPFSGDVDAATDALAELGLPADGEVPEALDDDDRRRLASLVALAVTGAEDATDRAGERVERALHPYVGGPFETLGGYADVLDAAARERPGIAVALALGHDGLREEALAAWRSHAQRAHAAVANATTRRYEGLFVARGGAMPVGTVARLVADFRSPEPVTLVVGEDEAAARSTDGTDVFAAIDAAVSATDGDATGTEDRARAQFAGERYEFVETFREAL